MGIGPYMSMITLNVNRLNAPTKRHRLDEWIQNKTRTTYLLSTKDHLRPRGTLRLKVGMDKHTFHANGNQKKSRVVIVIHMKLTSK